MKNREGHSGPKRILSLYDVSGVWSQPYADAGYVVHRVDLALGVDVRLLKAPNVPIQGILAAPPCTVFANSGNRWERSEEEMLDGLSTVDAVLRLVWAAKPKWWVLENPVGKLVHYLGEPTMRFDPCDYGDPYTKKTCLWGRFHVPKKTPVEPSEGSRMHKLSSTQQYERSVTPPGFSRAFFEANQ